MTRVRCSSVSQLLRAGGLVLILSVATAPASCDTESPAGDPTRETLPNGAVLVRYPTLPAIDSVGPEITEVHVDLRFGSLEGDDPNLTFTRIQGIQAASDGIIYVLEGQPDEVRVFSPDGEYLRTIVRRGEGPGETTGATGIILMGDTLLWTNDFRQRVIIGVNSNGEEIRRFKWLAYDPADYWSGAFDHFGRYWMSAYQIDRQRSGDITTAGLHTETYWRYYKSYDLSTEAIDSVPFGERVTQSYLPRLGNGLGIMPIPFVSSDVTAVRPSGGFWHSSNTAYRITRISERGDTLILIEAALPALPVTAEERSAYLDRTFDRWPGQRRAAERAADLIADFKPMFEDEGFFVDDEDRLWAKRTTPREALPFYDLFSEDGDYLGSVRLGFPPAPGSKVWVQHGNLYTWVVDELDVQYVVRAPLS